jgi:hypothetical protein
MGSVDGAAAAIAGDRAPVWRFSVVAFTGGAIAR